MKSTDIETIVTRLLGGDIGDGAIICLSLWIPILVRKYRSVSFDLPTRATVNNEPHHKKENYKLCKRARNEIPPVIDRIR